MWREKAYGKITHLDPEADGRTIPPTDDVIPAGWLSTAFSMSCVGATAWRDSYFGYGVILSFFSSEIIVYGPLVNKKTTTRKNIPLWNMLNIRIMELYTNTINPNWAKCLLAKYTLGIVEVLFIKLYEKSKTKTIKSSISWGCSSGAAQPPC